MLYGIDGKPLSDNQGDQTAQRLYQIQLMNMMLFQREKLMEITAQCNSALEKLSDLPEHKLEVRLIREVRDKAVDAAKEEAVSGFISGVQARLAYELCDKLVEEARLFDAAPVEDQTVVVESHECEELVRTLIANMLVKMAPPEVPTQEPC